MKKFKQHADDCIGGGLEKVIAINSMALQRMKEQKGADKSVETYRKKVQQVLTLTDQAMSPLLAKLDDGGPLINWAARMGSCQRMLDTLDKNLAFIGKRAWSWDEVIDAMSFLEAVTKGAKLTLWENGIDF